MLLQTTTFVSHDEHKPLSLWESGDCHRHSGTKDDSMSWSSLSKADLNCQTNQHKRANDNDPFSFSEHDMKTLKRGKFNGCNKSFTVLQGSKMVSKFNNDILPKSPGLASLHYPIPLDADMLGYISTISSMDNIWKPHHVDFPDTLGQSTSPVPCGLHDAATLCHEFESQHDDDSDVQTQERAVHVNPPLHDRTGQKRLEKKTVPTTHSTSLSTFTVVDTPTGRDQQCQPTAPHTMLSAIAESKVANDTNDLKSHCQDKKPGASRSPSKFDVLCGQSKNLNSHPGNRRFQLILDMYVPKYRKALNRTDRMLLTKEVIECVHSSGGRFLRCRNGVFEEISQVMARDKVSHAFRNRI